MQGNTEINGDIYGVGVVKGGTVNQNLILPEHKVPPQLTSKLGKNSIIGREKELKEIDELLNSSNSLLLINGIGGIGKSTIASYYLHSQKEKLHYYGFFEGIDSFINELREPLDLKQEKQQDAFMEALAKLRKLEGEKLLVIDDVKNIEENQEIIERILELKNSGYKILLTSREEIEDVEQYYLDVLSINDAKKLFNSIFEVEDEMLLEEILNYLDCHAFFVEMTAKTLKSKKTLTPELIKEKFENGEFSSIKRKRKESFNDYLNELFSFDELEDEEILMLKQLSVLPSIEIERNFLEVVFDRKDDEEFEELLNYLCEKGWLSSFEDRYKLHQIVKEYILVNYTPNFEEIELIVNHFNKFLGGNPSLEVALYTQNNIIYLENLVDLLEKIKVNNKKVGDLFRSLGLVYDILGFYSKSKSLHLRALEILNQESSSSASAYNSLANHYFLIQEYEKAEPLFLKSLEIYKEILNEEHLFVASSYHNLANLYLSMKKYEKAKFLALKALEIRKKNLGEEHLEIASSYHGLASIYLSMKKYKKAEILFLKSLKIQKGEYNSTIASTYNNLGVLYYFQKNYNQAYIHMERAFIIYTNIFSPNEHPNITSASQWLKEIKNKLSELKNDISSIKRNDPCPCNSGKKYKKCCGKNN